METGKVGKQSQRLKLLLVVGVVLLVRLPFLNQAIQGDDVYYLTEAEHGQIEPLHPTHFHYVFMGNSVDMRGHSHPPLNGWVLAMLLAAFGDIREVPFHAVYVLFSVIAALSMWSLAQLLSPHPLWATLLFVVGPVFVVNGNSLESDVPFLAFWMASIALFVFGRYLPAAAAMVLAALAAYQAVFLLPILALYLWLFDRKRRIAWAVTLVPLATVLAFQIFERVTLGSAPAAVLAGYLDWYGLTALRLKLRDAIALALHGCWLVCPLLLPPAAMLLWHARRDRKVTFLTGWIAIFLAGAIVVFYAGSARYVLPIAAPVALLVSALRPGWLAAGFSLQLTLALALAVVNYQHWDAYRRFAATLPTDHRIWINGDWGLRYYLEAEGGLPLQRLQTVRPGDIVVTKRSLTPSPLTLAAASWCRSRLCRSAPRWPCASTRSTPAPPGPMLSTACFPSIFPAARSISSAPRRWSPASPRAAI